ncbi:MAG TPA: saccharopine dehydrogenase NADP-binding domain-containing protein [Thermoanaerobaculia bacterium]|nr:saccharopine dehydrogenase NADP-binding domain-containing protein [Thermoanaerobaculia bacterium]
MTEWMIYGANGFTGELIAREAAKRGMRPLLAGRNAEGVGRLAEELGLGHRAFPVRRPDLSDVRLVLHCAGPFVHTSAPMVDACLGAGAHYLDITGEISVFEAIYARDGDARAAGVALIPGVGFDVVPTDGLAAMLARQLPGASELRLAFSTSRGSAASRGTKRTMIEGLAAGGAVRRDGRIVRVPLLFDVREIPFASGPRLAMTIPWGDVSSAFRTTGIPNIRVYSASSRRAIANVRRLSRVAPLLALRPLRRLAQRFVPRGSGPSAEQRERGRVELWGCVRRGSEERTASLSTPDGYALTVSAALAAVERALGEERIAGALTPSQAFGAEFITTLPGVRREA